MNGHDGLDAAEELVVLEAVVKHNRNQTGLPVMAVNDIRAEIKCRQCREDRLAEEGEFFDVLVDVAVRMVAREVELVVHEVEPHALVLQLKQSDVLASPGEIHRKVGDKLHLLLVLLRNRHILGQNDAHVKFILVDVLRERPDHIRKTARLDERNTFRCRKQNLFHSNLFTSRLCGLLFIYADSTNPVSSVRVPASPGRWPSRNP